MLSRLASVLMELIMVFIVKTKQTNKRLVSNEGHRKEEE